VTLAACRQIMNSQPSPSSRVRPSGISSVEIDRRAFLTAALGLSGLALISTGGLAADAPAEDEADLIIWDSTPAGLTAAVAAARAGLHVIIVTEDKHLGGVQTSGLGYTNAGQRA